MGFQKFWLLLLFQETGKGPGTRFKNDNKSNDLQCYTFSLSKSQVALVELGQLLSPECLL
jgi:hypothetical protein